MDKEKLKAILNVSTDEELKRALKYLQDFADLAADMYTNQAYKDTCYKIGSIMYWLRMSA